MTGRKRLLAIETARGCVWRAFYVYAGRVPGMLYSGRMLCSLGIDPGIGSGHGPELFGSIGNRSFRVRVPHISWARAVRFERFGGLRAYRFQSRVLHGIDGRVRVGSGPLMVRHVPWDGGALSLSALADAGAAAVRAEPMGDLTTRLEITTLIEETCRKLGRAPDLINWRWCRRMTAAIGQAKYTRNQIVLSARLWPRADVAERRNTVVHEVCHLIAHEEMAARGFALPPRDRRPHGRLWQSLMLRCGETPTRCHNVANEDLRRRQARFEAYRCERCGDVFRMTARKAVSMYGTTLAGSRYEHRGCGGRPEALPICGRLYAEHNKQRALKAARAAAAALQQPTRGLTAATHRPGAGNYAQKGEKRWS